MLFPIATIKYVTAYGAEESSTGNVVDSFDHASSLTTEIPARTERIVAALLPGLDEPTKLALELLGSILSSGPRSIFSTLPLHGSQPAISLYQSQLATRTPMNGTYNP
jgi:hypothetical protein